MDQTIIWIIVLGLIVLALGCCVLVALRQVTVLRGNLDVTTNQLTVIRDDQKRSRLLDDEQQSIAIQLQQQRNEQNGLSTRLVALEDGLKGVQHSLVEIQRQGLNAGSNATSSDFTSRKEDTKEVNSTAAVDVSQIYEEILTSLKSQLSATTPSASPSTRPDHAKTVEKGFGFSLPSSFIVYQILGSALYSKGQFRKYSHSIRLGATSKDIELIFTSQKGSDFHDAVFPLSALREVIIDTDDSLPDGSPSVRVELFPRSTFRPSVADSLTSRRKPHESVEDSNSGETAVFRFMVPAGPIVDDWVSFLMQHSGDCVVHPPL
jgi:hypothetical protein